MSQFKEKWWISLTTKNRIDVKEEIRAGVLKEFEGHDVGEYFKKHYLGLDFASEFCEDKDLKMVMYASDQFSAGIYGKCGELVFRLHCAEHFTTGHVVLYKEKNVPHVCSESGPLDELCHEDFEPSKKQLIDFLVKATFIMFHTDLFRAIIKVHEEVQSFIEKNK